MTGARYDASQIRVVSAEETFRERTGMYVGVARTDPRLPERLLSTIAGQVLHPSPQVTDGPVDAAMEVTGDLAFTLVMDAPRTPRPGYFGSPLLCFDWFPLAVAAALSRGTVVRVPGLFQEHTGLRPLTPPQESHGEHRTRVSWNLDPDLLAPGAALPRDLSLIDGHSPYCEHPPESGHLAVRDRRTGRTAVVR
ncbi:hypothetical protein [Nocardiopsis sp. CC223A]|uniref:hypothetical protein n=1 Tax=Nocardiopsis sp. CC223A TaxID=3044051 RepID=UPI00278BF66E|nr:hypothetical protein [Nocardiopsis sp. CC223A]